MSGATMFNLKKNPILLPYQIKILRKFFSSSLKKDFFLPGGTALSAFYFAHRESKDFDFFSIELFNFRLIDNLVAKIAEEMGATLSVKVAAESYREIYLENKKEDWVQRIDIILEQPKRFGKIINVEGINVDSLENIGSNKILTLYNRLEPKDYLDFYMIVTKTEWTFEKLFELAKQKDTGLFEFYFANSLANVEKITLWPEIKIPFNKEGMILYYQNLTKNLLLKLKPKE